MVVRYSVSGDQVVVPVPRYHDIAHYAPGSQVSLDVDGWLPDGHNFETVHVVGTASLAADGDRGSQAECPPSSQSPIDVIRVPLDDLQGLVARQA